MFQPKAWADTDNLTTWARGVFKDWKQQNCPHDEVLLFGDNLSSQKSSQDGGALREVGVTCVYGPPNRTECLQSCDAGHVGAALKSLARVAWDH